ncbi:MAG: hypothetical protein HYZ90_02590 [Candidatus Omnitrophica bacterium]|nr:hypothetical protein [Candidatus Omnitrophota bacterium]
MVHGVSSLLISAAAGYWVLAQSSAQRDRVKKLGQWLGLAIIVVSVVGTACKLYYATTGKSMGSMLCPPGKSCPFTSKSGGAAQ